MIPADHDADLAKIVHDLSQPLTALTNFLAAMQLSIDQDAPRATIAGLLATAVSEAARARAAVGRLQDAVDR